MALVQSTLASQLTALVPTAVEATAINALASAWAAYFAGASVMGAPITPAATTAARGPFVAALVGMSAPNAGALSIQSAITAFWGALAPLAATAWVIAPNVVLSLTPPPGIAGIAGALAGVFASNTAGNVDLATATSNIASVLHASGGLGGIAIVQPPLPAAPVPTPIL